MDESTKMTPAALKILDTASKLFYWKGIHSIGVETIAREAGVTKKTLYDRFGSKEQLIVAYLKDRDHQWKNHVFKYLERVPDHDSLQKILSIFDALESWLETKNPRGCSFVNALAELTEESHPGRKVILDEKRWLKQLFTTFVKQMGCHPPEEIAETLFILHEGVTVAYSMGLAVGGTRSAKETARCMLRAQENNLKC